LNVIELSCVPKTEFQWGLQDIDLRVTENRLFDLLVPLLNLLRNLVPCGIDVFQTENVELLFEEISSIITI
jgi:hypothetical protein